MAKFENGDRVTVKDELSYYNGRSGVVVEIPNETIDENFFLVSFDDLMYDKAYIHKDRLTKEKTRYYIGFYTSRNQNLKLKKFEVARDIYDKFILEVETLEEGETDDGSGGGNGD